jgi:hypothetical protein
LTSSLATSAYDAPLDELLLAEVGMTLEGMSFVGKRIELV